MSEAKHYFGNQKFRVLVEKARESNGWKASYEDRICRVDVTVDVAAIMAELGAKAIRNKSKRARALGGLVVVKASQEQRA